MKTTLLMTAATFALTSGAALADPVLGERPGTSSFERASASGTTTNSPVMNESGANPTSESPGTGAPTAREDRAGGAPGATAQSATPAAAGAAQTAAIGALPDSGRVTLKGTVQEVEDKNEFTLADTTGTIEVELSSETTLTKGQAVTITGDIDREWGQKEIDNASLVSEAD